jgi:hypothetical protein
VEAQARLPCGHEATLFVGVNHFQMLVQHLVPKATGLEL